MPMPRCSQAPQPGRTRSSRLGGPDPNLTEQAVSRAGRGGPKPNAANESAASQRHSLWRRRLAGPLTGRGMRPHRSQRPLSTHLRGHATYPPLASFGWWVPRMVVSPRWIRCVGGGSHASLRMSVAFPLHPSRRQTAPVLPSSCCPRQPPRLHPHPKQARLHALGTHTLARPLTTACIIVRTPVLLPDIPISFQYRTRTPHLRA